VAVPILTPFVRRNVVPITCLLLAVIVLAACSGSPEATSLPPAPLLTPEPWRLPLGPVTLENVTGLGRLGSSTVTRGTVYDLDFSADGRYMLAVSADDTVRMWETTTGRAVWALPQANTARAFFVLDDSQVALVTRNGEVQLYRTENQAAVGDFRGHSAAIGPAAVSSDGRLMALGAEDGTVAVWNLQDNRRLYTLRAHGAPVQELVFSPDGALLATLSAEMTVGLWDTASGARRATLTVPEQPSTVAFSPDGAMIAVGTRNAVHLWFTADGASLRLINTPPGAAIQQVIFTDDGQLLGSGPTQTISLWEIESGRRIASLPVQEALINWMTLNPDGDLLVTASFPGQAYLWNMDNLDQRFELSAEADEVALAAWSPDGRVLVLAGGDGTLYFWGLPGEVAPTPTLG